jgi:hypothetical protein
MNMWTASGAILPHQPDSIRAPLRRGAALHPVTLKQDAFDARLMRCIIEIH